MPTGRPSKMTPEVVDEICTRIAKGEPMMRICADDFMPAYRTVIHWQQNDEAFCAAIAKARADQQDTLVDQMIGLADSATPEDWQVKKLQIWARQWTAGRLAPKKYGDRLNVDQKSEVTVKEDLDLSALTKRQRDDLAKLLALARGSKG